MKFVNVGKIIFFFFYSIFLIQSGFYVSIPVTGTSATNSPTDQKEFISLASFINAVKNNSTEIVGVYSEDLMAFPVMQQPKGNPAFVSSNDGVVTQFSTATKYGSTGMIAHNYLAGVTFSEIDENDHISVIKGDGTNVDYVVTDIRLYQALTPSSAYSSFINLDNPNTIISYKDLFFEVYSQVGTLVLQTCITKGNEDSWGRLFVIAEPVVQKTASTK